MLTIDRIHEVIADLDELDAVQEKFAKEVNGTGGAAWAIERYAGEVIYARQMARIVRPLLETYAEIDHSISADEWIKMVKDVRREITDRLIRLHGRANSTSVLQNAINHHEAEAMSHFIQRMNYIRWE